MTKKDKVKVVLALQDVLERVSSPLSFNSRKELQVNLEEIIYYLKELK
jgi:hypothetical protein